MRLRREWQRSGAIVGRIEDAAEAAGLGRRTLHSGLALALGLAVVVRGLQWYADRLDPNLKPPSPAPSRAPTPTPVPKTLPTPPSGPAVLVPPTTQPKPSPSPTPVPDFATIPGLVDAGSGSAFYIGHGLFVTGSGKIRDTVYPVDLPSALTSGRVVMRDAGGFLVFTVEPGYVEEGWKLPLATAASLKPGDEVKLYTPGRFQTAWATRTRFLRSTVEEGRTYLELQTSVAPLGTPVMDAARRVVGIAVAGADRNARFLAADHVIDAVRRLPAPR